MGKNRHSSQYGRATVRHQLRHPVHGSVYTEPKGEAADGDLFGDSGNPQITLVGTVHSGKNYNFAGFLQEDIGADILNVAFPGGGLEGSMLQYLGSDEFQKSPPKILIWEFSPLYRLDQETIYRQMMALLDNGCEGKDAQMSASTTLKPGSKQELLVNSKNMNLRNSSHQVDISFADTSVKTLQASLWYMNGRHEDMKIEKPETSDTDGRFAFELRTDKDWGCAETCWQSKFRARKRAPRHRKSKRKSANATYSRALGNTPLRSGNEVCYAKSNDQTPACAIPAHPGDVRRGDSGRRATASASGLLRPCG